MNMFQSMLDLTALDHGAAAHYLGIRQRRIGRWVRDAEAPSGEALRRLAKLMDDQQIVADEICDAWEAAGEPAQFSYGVSPDDASAQALGWPSRAAQLRAVAIAQMVLSGVKIEIIDAPGVAETAQAA